MILDNIMIMLVYQRVYPRVNVNRRCEKNNGFSRNKIYNITHQDMYHYWKTYVEHIWVGMSKCISPKHTQIQVQREN